MRSSPGYMPSSGVVVWARNAFTFVLSLFTLPLEAVYRHDFGERYFRLYTLIIGAVVYSVFAGGSNLMGGGLLFGGVSDFSPGRQAGLLTWLFLVIFLALSVYHRYRIFQRNWYTGPEWHSQASGESWLQRFTSPLRSNLPFFVPIPNFTQRFIEPLLAIVVGFIFSGSFLGGWLILGGAALLVKEQLKADVLRNAYLDQVDQQIESAARVELLTSGWTEESGQADPQTAVTRNGYTASIPLPTRTAKQRQDSRTVLREMFPDEWNRAEKQKTTVGVN